MIFVRPVSLDDLDPLCELAALAGVGLTTLPKDREVLKKRIVKSQRSIEAIPDRPGGESYLMVMVDGEIDRIIGASGMVSKVGGFEPFYAYRIENTRFRCDLLHVSKDIPLLHLVREHDGPAEIGSLFLHPDYRGSHNGRFLQLVRFLFMALHPEAFEPLVVGEMRGVIDVRGRSAFWDAVGKHFFEIEFPEADYLSVVNKKFIADLMPTHPLYVPLLPEAAQKVIAQVHEESKPALKTLEAEGFVFSGMVDIFDAGACVSCQRDEIRTIRQSRKKQVEALLDGPPASAPYLLATTAASNFRACVGRIREEGEGLGIERECAKTLGIDVGQEVCFAPLRAAPAAGGNAP
jgi:arginine N-succinyltransferase